MTNKFNDTLNKLMTSTQYQDQEEVLRDLEVLGKSLLYRQVNYLWKKTMPYRSYRNGSPF